jgi:hypothetical protein
MSAEVSRRSRWLRLLAWQFAVTVIVLFAAEGAWRLRMRWAGRAFDSDEVRDRLVLMASRATSLVPEPFDANKDLPRESAGQAQALHPYTGSIVVGKIEQIGAELVRVGPPEYDEDFEILTVGGSVSAMFGLYGLPRTLELLRADPLFAHRRIYVYEYGIGGFKQPQSLNLAQHLLTLGFTPECVINIDGFNEVALGNGNSVQGSNPTFPSISHWGALTSQTAPDRETVRLAWNGMERQAEIVSLVNTARALGVSHSVLASTLVLKRLDALEASAHASFEAYTQRLRDRSKSLVLAGPPFKPGAAEAARMSVKCWEESSRTLRALCEARGILYLHVLQPTLHDVGSKVLTPEEVADGHALESWIEGVHTGYPLLRIAGERLRAGGEDFLDATHLFAPVKEKIYFDCCHFGETGNRMLGELIAAELLRRLHAPR